MAFAKHAVVVSVLAASLGFSHAGSAQEPQKLFFEGDMVRGAGPGLAGPGCVLTSQFKRNEMVVWRIRVLDPKSGRPVDAKGLKSLVVQLPDGQKFDGHYGGHPKGKTDDFFWTAAWKVPQSYPTGTIAYKVVATDQNGQVTTWEPFKVALSQLTVVQ